METLQRYQRHSLPFGSSLRLLQHLPNSGPPSNSDAFHPFHTYMDLPFPPHLAQYTCRDILARRHHDQGTHTLAIP